VKSQRLVGPVSFPSHPLGSTPNASQVRINCSVGSMLAQTNQFVQTHFENDRCVEVTVSSGRQKEACSP